MLLKSSIKENFKILNPFVSNEEIISISKMVKLHDFIMKLPEQYDTNIDKKGMDLSVGQKQRLAIARAILRKPQILLFDEITSSLDSDSEKAIIEIIKNLPKNMIVIIIAHRLSTIEYCDLIYVIDKGKVVEKGTHKDLLSKKGTYFRYYTNHDSSSINPN